jgi:uncharacterized protein YndB with AHSA1/START domain
MPQKLSFFVPVCLVLALTACGQPRAEERAIVESITVKANLNDVWNAWTTTEGIKSFFAPDAKIEAKPGGAFHVYINPLAPAGMKGADDTVFLAVQPKRMISFTWNAPPSLPEARQQRTVVVVRFVARSEALTEVSLHHSGWGEAAADNEWGKAYDYFAKAWPNVLKNLKKRFDDGPVD